MKIDKKYTKIIENNLIYLSTCSCKKIPRVIVCADAKVFLEKILITDNYMGITKKNILENNLVSLCVGEERKGFLYIQGKVDYKTSGKYYTYVKSLKENRGFPCRGVLVVSVNKITFGK